MGQHAIWVRLLLLQLLHMAGKAGALPGRHFGPGRNARQKHRESLAAEAGPDRRGRKMLRHALAGVEVERAGAEVLQHSWSHHHGRVGDHASDGTGTVAAGGKRRGARVQAWRKHDWRRLGIKTPNY